MPNEHPQKPVVIRVVRKKGHHGGHHGGAWKVAYADFITCMFALFLVMWLLTQADVKLRQDIAQYFRQPGVFAGGSIMGDHPQPSEQGPPQIHDEAPVVVPGTGDETSALRGRAAEIEEALAAPELEAVRQQVRLRVTAEGLEIQVVDSGAAGKRELLFDLSSAELKPALVTLLAEIATRLAELPNPVEIGGHTDAHPFPAGSALSNWDLSYQRADNARQVMEAHGLPRGQVLRLAAYGDAQPLNTDNPLADENRRLSILARRMAPATEADPAAEDDAPTESGSPVADRLPDPVGRSATDRG